MVLQPHATFYGNKNDDGDDDDDVVNSSKCHLLQLNIVPGTELITFHELSHLILATRRVGKCYHYSHFTDEETEPSRRVNNTLKDTELAKSQFTPRSV